MMNKMIIVVVPCSLRKSPRQNELHFRCRCRRRTTAGPPIFPLSSASLCAHQQTMIVKSTHTALMFICSTLWQGGNIKKCCDPSVYRMPPSKKRCILWLWLL